MWTAEVVLVCALNLLGRAPESFPPIALIDTVPADASPGAEGFVRHNDPHIYLVTAGVNFRAARASEYRCSHTMAIRKIASVLIHEEAHLRQSANERTAYEAQLTTLTALGAGPGSPPYQEVVRAMRTAIKLERQRLAPAELLASTLP